jgi:pyridoxine 5-phosphate synthase
MEDTKLSVNINKIATLRNSRGGALPSVVDAAINAERFGADGITVHPRPDERHIRYADVHDLSKVVTTEFNIEGYPNKKFIELVLQARPTQVTLVPDGPDVLTSDAGWDTVSHRNQLQEVIAQFKEAGIRTSVFIDADEGMIAGASEIGADRIELYTERFAVDFESDPEAAVAPFRKAAMLANDLGLGINAGHDLNLKNLRFFSQNVPGLLEVSIGHALISDSIYLGFENAINMYKHQLR